MRTYIYIVALLMLFTSCDDWLDIKPKGKIIPQKVEDYRLLMDQAYSRGESVGVVESYGGDLYLSDDIVITDDRFESKYGESIRNAYTFEDHIYLEEQEDPDWTTIYNQIYMCNIVIAEVKSATGGEDEKNQLYAEAIIHRAFAYLNLVNLYGKHYNSSTAATDLGVPLLIEPAIEGSLERSTVKDVYDLILSDLDAVYNDLPGVQEQSYRPSKASASALLARTYLLMGDFNKALSNADESLSYYNFMYNYNELPKNAWYANMIDLPNNHENKEQILWKEPQNSYELIYPSQQLKDLYDLENDLRFTGMFETEWFPPYADKIYLQEYLVGRTCGLSVPEMILTRAECNARNGNISDAMSDVNLIRQNRIKTEAYTELTATDAADALIKVKQERRRELAFKGSRWFDIKRYNAYDDANISIDHSVAGKSHILLPGDNKWAQPIARKYILKNREIEQNPR
ncbi:RagB/SusD family nutrient uptake outer membrane protein [Ancylomarina salipaludis]|uniref:RagB/SusD family nutrient uptake outer membrane protein n=1 Tax=Ancylomarina salipaludis TaxID=2501299 RepID=A0A4Q1JJI8_9BACT|nr:RagB/SusD family nutrient uptake outer membrane protein [Ancylomarina salipaludis]RXQ90984.1 RagB/SusD family nutrient uptake outer membrane protein [Ancylomarina salipaludis]